MSDFAQFVSPHCHIKSLDSASTPKRFAEREVELGTGHIVVTDHGTLEATRTVYDLCAKGGKFHGKLSPVLGLEAYFRDDNDPILLGNGYKQDENGKLVKSMKYAHLTMHAMDESAYFKLVKILSDADFTAEQHGSERKPLFKWADLEVLGAENMTMTSGCLIGMVGRHLLANNDLKSATQYYEKLRSLTKPGNFYVEIFPHVTDKYFQSGIFLTFEDGTVVELGSKRKLRTEQGEVFAEDLAADFRKDAAAARKTHKGVLDLMENRKWSGQVLGPLRHVELREGFVHNECTPWCSHGDYQQEVNKILLGLAEKYGDPVLISDDSHFAVPEEKIIQDTRLGGWRFAQSHHRMASSEAWEHFRTKLGTSEAQFGRWVENTREWAARFKGFSFSPRQALPTSFYPTDTLRHTMELIKQHRRMDWSNPAMVERLRAEIKLLHKSGVDLLSYFFVDEEVCSLYRKKGELTGPGRGSAGGLLLANVLGITHFNPLDYDLSMDRFMTPDRIASGKLPDIDQDLPHRDLLVDPNDPSKGWLADRFGACVAKLSVDQQLKLKNAIKDVHRIKDGFVSDRINAITKALPNPPQGVETKDVVFGYEVDGVYTPGLLETDATLQSYVATYPQHWEIVKGLLGLPRQKGGHPCGFVISGTPIDEFIPMTSLKDGTRVTSYTGPSVEAAGGLKMDFLVVNSIRDIGRAIRLVQERHAPHLVPDGETVQFVQTIKGKECASVQALPYNNGVVDIWDLPVDEAVYRDIAEGRVETVFQLDGGAARQGLKYFGPKPDGTLTLNSLEGLSAFTALDRPGPLDAYVDDGEGGKHNMLVEYAIRAAGGAGSGRMPVLDDLCSATYGVIVYQEQLEKIFKVVGGTTGIEATAFRSRIGKKKIVEVRQKDKPLFMKGAVEKLGKEEAERLWESMETFGQYGFNKSVLGTVILPYKGGFKQLQEFTGGEIVNCVDENGCVQETEVVALHDHGDLEAFEATFDDGYTVTVSGNHKFLTPEGQRPLYDIALRGLGVYSQNVQNTEVEAPEKVSSVLSGSSQVGGTGPNVDHSVRSNSSEPGSVEGASPSMPAMCGSQEGKHSGAAVEAQPESGAAAGVFEVRAQNLSPSRHSTSESRTIASLAKSKSRKNPSHLGVGAKSSQAVKNGGLAKVQRDPDLGRGAHSLRRDAETSGLCQFGLQDLGGSRRVLAFCGSQACDRSGARQDTEGRVPTQTRCDIDSASRGVFRQFQRSSEARVGELAYSDAPLASAGNLVLRKVVRVRSVGVKRMYDLEVAHPKHNFLLANGTVTSNSHSVAYMHTAYACAFMKHHYPLEWWTAVLSNADKKDVDEKFWRYIGPLVLMPDISKSSTNFVIENDKIRAPVWLVHGIGEKAFALLETLRPVASIEDLLQKLEDYKIKNGTPITKTVTKKTKAGPITQTVQAIKKAHNPLNDSILRMMIVCGIMDSLFPTLDANGLEMTPADKLSMFDIACQTVRGKKVKPSAAKFNLSSEIARYQYIKKIMPAYSAPSLPMIRRLRPDGFRDFSGNVVYYKALDPKDTAKYGVLNGSQFEWLENLEILPDSAMEIALPAYVLSQRIFPYKNNTKKACELVLDIDGHRRSFVKWPSSTEGLPPQFREPLAGAMVVALFGRRNPSDDFFFRGIDVLAGPPNNEESPVSDD